MPVMLQVRNVPDELHRKLRARAKLEGVTLSDLLLREARQAVELPSMDEWLRQLKRLKPIELGEPAAEMIRRGRGKL